MRRVLLFLVAILIAGFIAFYFLRKKEKPVFPDANVLLITIDTIRPDHLSCYGSSNPTPNMDALAKNGLIFENAFCQVPLTFPSHTSILTGLFPVHHSIHQNGLEIFNQKENLITEQFKANGYKTGAVVSAFVLDRKFGLAAGFDEYDDRMERLPTIISNFEVERRGVDTVAAAMRLLQNFADQKWFLWVHFYDPHTPYSPPPPYSGYAGEITYVDEQVGRLLQQIRELHSQKQMVVALLGDHGESLGEHGENTHGFFVYNSTLKIPMILSYPGVRHARITHAVAAVDVAPTLLELAGIRDVRKRDGQSLLVKNRTADIYFESLYAGLLGWNGLQGLIRNNWKLISTTRSELYEWQQDPQEHQNLFSAKQNISAPIKEDLLTLASASGNSGKLPDSETIEKLKSLGYIGTASIPKKNRSADPKDKIELWSIYEETLEPELRSQPAELTRLLQSLVQQEPENNFFRMSLASHYRQNNNLQAATEQLREAIHNDPSDATAYHELAVTYKEMKNYPEALRAGEAALALEPERSEFHGIRGMILVETGRFAEARQEFQRVIHTDPNNAVAWNNLGNALRALNDLPAAYDAYKKSIELSPNYAYPQNGIGTILVRQKKSREAIPYFEKALQLDPKFIEVYLNLGIAFHSLEETERARTLYLSFLKVAPDWMSQEKETAKMLLAQIP